MFFDAFGRSLIRRTLAGMLFFVAAASFRITQVSGEDISWIGTSGYWSTVSNWDIKEPKSSDNAFINNGGTASISSTGEACSFLYLGNAAGQSGSINMSAGGLNVFNTVYVGNSGSGTFTQSGGTIITPGVVLGSKSGSTGTYNLSGASQLSVHELQISNGSFNQFGGTNSISYGLISGVDSRSGTYSLSGTSRLSASYEYIGSYGTGLGSFEQTGGTNISDDFILGFYSGSHGSYNLSGAAALSTNREIIGYDGSGSFTQTGGTNSISGGLVLSSRPGSSGCYSLSGLGYLSASYESIRAGSFTQTGGTNTIPNQLSISSGGNYNLSGASLLSALDMDVGTGTFMQTGGTNSISNLLAVSSGGNYNLSGAGQLSALDVDIGESGVGTFTQSGGTHSVSGNLNLGDYSGSTGTYNLTGGTLILKSLSKGSGSAQFNFGGGTLQASDTFSTTLAMTLTGTGGNATFDTAGYTVTFGGVLSGSGGLKKIGAGNLLHSGKNTYSGETTVSVGVLQISDEYTSGGKISVADGAGIVFGTPYTTSSAPENASGSTAQSLCDPTVATNEIAAVPEPGTWIFLVFGAMSYVLLRIRNIRK